MSELLDETTDDVEAAAGAETETGDEVARADEPVDVPAPAEVPAINWDDPALQERIAQQSQQQSLALLERLGLISYDEPKVEGPPAPDPLSDNFQAELDRYLEFHSAAQNAPLQEYIAQQQQAQVESVIGGALTSAAKDAKLEDVDTTVLRGIALQFAEQPEYARYGATIEGVQATAKAAAGWIAARDKASEERGVTRYRTQIGEIQDTPAEPSAGGGGGLAITAKPKSYDDIIAKYADR